LGESAEACHNAERHPFTVRKPSADGGDNDVIQDAVADAAHHSEEKIEQRATSHQAREDPAETPA